jgi:hypothetical protein
MLQSVASHVPIRDRKGAVVSRVPTRARVPNRARVPSRDRKGAVLESLFHHPAGIVVIRMLRRQ